MITPKRSWLGKLLLGPVVAKKAVEVAECLNAAHTIAGNFHVLVRTCPLDKGFACPWLRVTA